MVLYIIRCSNVALVRLVSLSVGMHCGTSCTRTHATLSQKSLTPKQRDGGVSYICSTTDPENFKNKLANVILNNGVE